LNISLIDNIIFHISSTKKRYFTQPRAVIKKPVPLKVVKQNGKDKMP